MREGSDRLRSRAALRPRIVRAARRSAVRLLPHGLGCPPESSTHGCRNGVDAGAARLDLAAVRCRVVLRKRTQRAIDRAPRTVRIRGGHPVLLLSSSGLRGRRRSPVSASLSWPPGRPGSRHMISVPTDSNLQGRRAGPGPRPTRSRRFSPDECCGWSGECQRVLSFSRRHQRRPRRPRRRSARGRSARPWRPRRPR